MWAGPTGPATSFERRNPMTIGLTPYLRFAGDAKEAMEFYHQVLGGELSMMTFREGANEGNPAFADLIMHS